uniref:Ig-like domain-containing protein n=1 Tax=Neolamprologus brichardi TaxID=32507 RepID=A0A3Q4I885_NEOBR
MASSFLCLLFISLNGFMTYRLSRCDFNSTELKDIQFTDSYYYNMIEIISASWRPPPLDLLPGWANSLNALNAPLSILKRMKSWSSVPRITDGLSFPAPWHRPSQGAPPTVKLHSTMPLSSHHPAMLVCSVYDFFPSKIKVSWHRDGQEVTSDVTSTEEMEDGDWYYQTHCYLEYTPRSGEKISCVVEHASLEKPLITNWDPSSSSFMPKTERDKLAIGASGLLLCLILSLAGFIYYRQRARGRILVPTN